MFLLPARCNNAARSHIVDNGEVKWSDFVCSDLECKETVLCNFCSSSERMNIDEQRKDTEHDVDARRS